MTFFQTSLKNFKISTCSSWIRTLPPPYKDLRKNKASKIHLQKQYRFPYFYFSYSGCTYPDVQCTCTVYNIMLKIKFIDFSLLFITHYEFDNGGGVM